MIAWLPHATNPVFAGARIRCLTPLRILRQRGVRVELFRAEHAQTYCAIVVQGLRCRSVPGDPATGDGLLELVARLKRNGCRIAVEDCDNHFYNPQRLPEWDDTAQRLRVLVGMADHLIASTEAMADVFRRETATTLPIALIGDAVEEEADLNFDPAWRRTLSWRRKLDWARWLALRADIAVDRALGRRPLLWFGSSGASHADGGMRDLSNIAGALERTHARVPLSLTVISNSRKRYEELVDPMGIPTRYLNWSRATFLAALRLHELAVIPVTQTPFTVCKSNNRLLLALRNGLAVCADPIPSYAEFANVCRLGDWEPGLEQYLRAPQQRRQHTTQAQELIAHRWSREPIADQWQRLFETLADPMPSEMPAPQPTGAHR